MSTNDDRLFEAWASLPPIAPDAGWESRVRARCHSAISRRARFGERAGRTLSHAALAAISGAALLCLYLAVMLAEGVRLPKHC
jgi:hypothetical protein